MLWNMHLHEQMMNLQSLTISTVDMAKHVLELHA